MMKDMKKDKTIERAFREYFDGTDAPHCDLTRAKQAVRAGARRTRKRGWLSVLIPALACVLLVCAVSLGVLFGDRLGAPQISAPQDDGAQEPQVYSLASAQAENTTYAQLSAQYADLLGGLSRFAWADNAQADYTLYRLDGDCVLLYARLKYLRGLHYWEADVYLDLTDGALFPEELSRFQALRAEAAERNVSYLSQTDYLNGEYVSEAVLSLPAAQYCLSVMGTDGNAVDFLRALLSEQA